MTGTTKSRVSDARRIEAVTGRRVYEYTDAEGVIYWSSHRTTNFVNPPKRLTLKSRIGEHLINFLVRLRRETGAAGAAGEADKGDVVG